MCSSPSFIVLFSPHHRCIILYSDSNFLSLCYLYLSIKTTCGIDSRTHQSLSLSPSSVTPSVVVKFSQVQLTRWNPTQFTPSRLALLTPPFHAKHQSQPQPLLLHSLPHTPYLAFVQHLSQTARILALRTQHTRVYYLIFLIIGSFYGDLERRNV